jgi:iron(III) transport system substrate-binding protein
VKYRSRGVGRRVRPGGVRSLLHAFRHRFLPAVASAVLLALGGCAGGERDPDLLVVYSAGPRPLAEAVTQAFAREHQVEVELFAATTGQVMARLEAERHRPRADVVIFASRVAADALRESGRLLAYPDPPWLDETHRAWHDPEGYFHATSAALVGVALRSDLDWLEGAEPDWEDLLLGTVDGTGDASDPGHTQGGRRDGGTPGDPPFRVTLPAPSRSGAAGDFVVAYTLARGEGVWDLYLAAREGGLEIAAANSQAITSLLMGAHQAIVGAVDYLIYNQIAQGAPVRMHYPASGAVLVERPVAILGHTPVPELARAFVDFYLTPAMQEEVAARHLLPARLDVAPSQVRGGTAEIPRTLPVDAGEALREQARILRRFQLEVERAEVVRRR